MSAQAESSSSNLLQPFYPALDGLRALAFLAVFGYHCGLYMRWVGIKWTLVEWGWAGVDLFFVLSGFLITGILYDTLGRSDYFRSFFIRRALRIFPLYFGFWIIILLLTPVIHVEWNKYLVSMVLYCGNFFLPGWRLGLHANPSLIVYHSFHVPHEYRSLSVEHFWTLCIEEQFYLFWPILIFVFGRTRLFLRVVLAFLVASPLIRYAYLRSHPEMVQVLKVYHTTWFHMDGLLAGACLALWLRQTQMDRTCVVRIAYALAVIPLAIFAAMIWFIPGAHFAQNDMVVNTIGYSLISLAATGLLLLSIDPTTRVAVLLQFGRLRAYGKISYGLYFFHLILLGGMVGTITLFDLAVSRAVLALLATSAIAWLSFHFFEAPFLRLKHVFAPRSATVPNPPREAHP